MYNLTDNTTTAAKRSPLLAKSAAIVAVIAFLDSWKAEILADIAADEVADSAMDAFPHMGAYVPVRATFTATGAINVRVECEENIIDWEYSDNGFRLSQRWSR